MRSRVVAGGLLAVLAVLVSAVPAEAFGRRAASSRSCTAVYCLPAECSPCPLPLPCPPPGCWPCPPAPPCPLPLPIPTGVDCVCNHTGQVLRIHITSGLGHAEAVVPPSGCFYFAFRKDNLKNRVVSAFTLNNDLVASFDFAPLDQVGLPAPACLPIHGTTAGPTKAAPQRTKGDGPGAVGQPANPAL